jgi:diadenosine tetraphosphate (Ap4A) HIT family hydrolase
MDVLQVSPIPVLIVSVSQYSAMHPTPQECTFCSIVAGETAADVVFQTEAYCCIRDRYPVTDGHTLLLPKRHVRLLEAADWASLNATLDRAIEHVRSETNPDGLNVGIKDGPAAGQTVPHLHWHIIPRYEGDTANPAGGVRGVIPKNSSTETSWPRSLSIARSLFYSGPH